MPQKTAARERLAGSRSWSEGYLAVDATGGFEPWRRPRGRIAEAMAAALWGPAHEAEQRKLRLLILRLRAGE